MTRLPPRVLSIAGSDSGGGAGIQADLKTFCAHRVYGMTVVTAVTAQNTRGVEAVHAVPADVVAKQLDAVLSDIGADAIKIGMLANAMVARAVAAGLRSFRRDSDAPIVLDPVMVAKGGAALLDAAAVAVVRDELLPLARVVTPNLPEAEALAGQRASDGDERRAVARMLHARGPAVLLKGGHSGESPVRDLLVAEGEEREFCHPRLDTRSDHGTGCTLSSALAARLALGESLAEAAEGAIEYLLGAMAGAHPLGDLEAGHGPVDHLHLFRPAAKAAGGGRSSG